MRKTLPDLAVYLKETLVPKAQEPYTVNPGYISDFTEEEIREGAAAFRYFLSGLYDILAAEGDTYDNCKKAAHEYENRTTLSVYYPFLHNVNTMLINIGYYGAPSENRQALICGNNIFNEKLSVPKTLECLRFLAECGLCADGINLNDKKQSFEDIDAITITHPDAPAMLAGMKAFAIAEKEHRTLVNQDVLMRCDYRIFKKDETDVLCIVQDTVKPLPADIQDFVLQLHRRYLDKGLTCAVEVKGYHIYIKYSYKRKDFWGLNASLNNGFHINVKPLKTEEYSDTIKTFSPDLQKIIAKGYGCGRKNEVGHCNGGCRGLTVPLDDSVLKMQGDIVTWFDTELAHLQKK